MGIEDYVNKDLAMFLVGFFFVKAFRRWMTKTFVEPEPAPVDPDAPATVWGRCWEKLQAADAKLVEFLARDPVGTDDAGDKRH